MIYPFLLSPENIRTVYDVQIRILEDGDERFIVPKHAVTGDETSWKTTTGRLVYATGIDRIDQRNATNH